MFNYKSIFLQKINEPIVVSFNKGENKNYRFGFSDTQEEADYDRSVVVLENNIHWKSELSKEISTIKTKGKTFLYNYGNKIYGEYIHIMSDEQS